MKQIIRILAVLFLVSNLSIAGADEVSQLIDQLKQAEDYAEAESIWNRLIEIGSPAVDPLIQLFISAFTSTDEQIKTPFADIALYIIAQIGDKRAVEPLINFLGNSQYINFYADIIEVLGALKDTRAFESIASKYEEYKDREDFEARRITSKADYALTILGDPRALPIFRKKAEEYPSEGGRSAGRGAIMELARKFAETNNQDAIEYLKAMLDIGLKVTITLNEEYTAEKFNEEINGIKGINWIREEVAQALRKLGVEVKAEKYKYDTTPPIVRIISPQDGVSGPGKITIVTEATDDLSGIDEVNFYINGRESYYRLELPYEYEWNTLLYDPGNYRVQVKATDFAGNVGESATITLTVSGAPQDITSPTTTDNYQYNGVWTNQDTSITLTATDDISGVAHTYYTIDGIQYEGTTINIAEEGQHTVQYWSVDKAGNIEPNHTTGIWIDKTPPVTIATVNPSPNQSGWNNTLPIKITFSATDNLSGIKTTTPNIDITQEGIYNSRYQSIDNAGNVESEKTITVSVDITPPEVTITAEPSILWPVDKKPVKVTINGTATDAGSGISSKVFTVNDEYNEVKTSLSDFGQAIELIAWRTGDDKDGRIYTIKVVVTDKAGNSTTKETTVTVPHDMGK